MIQQFIDKFLDNKPKLEAVFADDYGENVIGVRNDEKKN